MNLILIGYRGTGKTAVGRRLSEAVSWPWADADELIERRAGRSIAALFAASGEEAFRDLESQVVRELAAGDGVVLALGGGAVLRAENRAALRGRGTVVWLRATPETIVRRLADDATTPARRPNLTATGGASEVRALLAARTPVYAAMADVTIDTDERSVDDVVTEVLRRCDLRPMLERT
jgi:shikimate kinase